MTKYDFMAALILTPFLALIIYVGVVINGF